MAPHDYLVGEVVEDYSDRLLTRREALRRLCLLPSRLPTSWSSCARGRRKAWWGKGAAKYPDEQHRFPGSGESGGRFQRDPGAVVTAVLIGLVVWLAAAAAFLMLHGHRLRVVRPDRDPSYAGRRQGVGPLPRK